MAWTKYHYILAGLLVVTGSFNTMSMKWADRTESKGIDDKVRKFNHPFFQAMIMFFGEIMCLVAFKILMYYYKSKDNSQDERLLCMGNREFSNWLFLLPASCDVISTSLMYCGLTLTYAASFQMLRGSLIIFVAMLSIGFLRRKISPREWIGVFFVIAGLILVGVSDFLIGETDGVSGKDVLIGDLLIVLSQVFTAVQFVLEEFYVANKNIPPLQAVGLEGCFGLCIMGLLLIPLFYIQVGPPISTNPHGRLENLNDAFMQIENNLILLLPLTGAGVSISFFNFAGVAITKELSSTTRTVLDTIRTFFIWAASLILGWQKFSGLQVFGFVLLLIGIFVYNDVFIPIAVRKIWELIKSSRRKREEPLVAPPEQKPPEPPPPSTRKTR